MMKKPGSLVVVGLVYLAAVMIGLETASAFDPQHPVSFAFIADIAATLVVFAFSCWYRNASTYDPFWSVIPILLVIFWVLEGQGEGIVVVRQVLVGVLICTWGLRLTSNWVARWGGLGDEDWRFGMLRQQHGNRYWRVNLGGIHMLPTLLVFGACLAAYPALADSSRRLNWLDLAAAVVTFSAIWTEARADAQLRAHRQASNGKSLEKGLWALCRHPNYLGETGFWWGLYLFALAANPQWWWTVVGALGINLLFVFVSIPMMDKHMLKRYPDYVQRMRNVPAMIPRLK